MDWLRLAFGLALMTASALVIARSLYSFRPRGREQERFRTARRAHFSEAHDFGVPFDERAFREIVEEFSRSEGSE